MTQSGGSTGRLVFTLLATEAASLLDGLLRYAVTAFDGYYTFGPVLALAVTALLPPDLAVEA